MLATLITTFLMAGSPCQAPAEDSLFWDPAYCGNHRGCRVTAPWPAPRNVPFCRSIRYQ